MKYTFNSLNIASFESRRSKELQQIVLYYEGNSYNAETSRYVESVNKNSIDTLIQNLKDNSADILILQTAIGTKILLQSLEGKVGKKDTIRLLNKTTIIARGIKTRSAIRNYGIEFHDKGPAPNTWQDIINVLSAYKLGNKTIVIQEQTRKNVKLANQLRSLGAEILSIPVYKSTLPKDMSGINELIDMIADNRIDICLFTNSQQIKNVIKCSDKLKITDKLFEGFKNVVIASIGKNTTNSLRDIGLSVDYEPENPRMGNLVREIARRHAYLILKKKTAYKKSIDTNNWKKIDMDWGYSEKKRKSMTKNSAFIKACRKQNTPFTPIWIMRQAGRFSRHYRQIRAKYTFQQLCKTPEIASEVTLMAVDQLGVDAAIIFSDILLILEPLGVRLTYTKSDGPKIIKNIFKTSKSLNKVYDFDEDKLDYVYNALQITRKALNPDIPLIGFAGAPFTLASYAIEGGASRNYENTKGMMYRDTDLWNEIMKILTNATIKYLNKQIDSGADAVQIFDSWIGCLSPNDYERYVLPHMAGLFRKLKKTVPSIHFGTGTATLLKLMREAGGDVIGLDWRVELDKTWEELGYDVAVQGNLDPVVLFSTPSIIKQKVKNLLERVDGRPGHIFNLGHGVLPGTPPDNVLCLIDAVHEYSSKH